MMPHRSYRQIASQHISPEAVKAHLASKVQGIAPGTLILFSTHLVDNQLRFSGMNHSEHEDVIVNENYLGIAGANGENLLVHLNPGSVLSGTLVVQTNVFVSDHELSVERNSITVRRSLRCTPLDQPIPPDLLPGLFSEKRGDVYPFMIFVGQQAIEEYLLGRPEDLRITDFYVVALRMLDLPEPLHKRLRDIDQRKMEEFVLSLYEHWTRYKPQQHSRECVAVIQGTLARLNEMRVKDKGYRVDVPSTPGLSLDVTAFLNGMEEVFPKEKK
ncbi:MAG: hypothetical protein A2408_03300 [Candidatus Yonathbacteria bacterium RIFOXYC1_FULL_52_10]|uniref:Uncharacterized protein n=1 Tax=Candidatus Yonathbacteria bacterium RIFOXYD1_FULL_52_36 TaxID=1802730 RepID=A0A1G2SLS3_9BACT|nr:MAG: hypothetical protein A2408_03300 [Candidatus Yonathbacteria bacterium RIFOXYC1_FULL_52_10]OHA85967.1 MAG: hypothetical protein A2591_00170 [Candidatus Yonathbacteria bacterium RIFOXYD1_FULL_52_36]